jgi:hypothetical protein
MALAACTAEDDASTSTSGGTAGGDLAAAVNGTCAPHGELFTDHFSCDGVEGPDPTSQSDDGPSVKVLTPDPTRLDDPDLGWVKEEIRSCSCICCHNDEGIGAYVWSYEMEPFFLDGVTNDRLGRFTDPAPAHAPVIPPDDNNGFTRIGTGWPSTDPGRFLGFVDRERERRGL